FGCRLAPVVTTIEVIDEQKIADAGGATAAVQNDIQTSWPGWIVAGWHDQAVGLYRAIHRGDESADASSSLGRPRLTASRQGLDPFTRPPQCLFHKLPTHGVDCGFEIECPDDPSAKNLG